MYKDSDLLWVKNVKKSKGKDWAYMEFGPGDSFELNWPKKFKSNVLKPKNGEIILLFQTIQSGLDKPKGTYLTHLVTPISSESEYRAGTTHPYVREVGVIARATPQLFTRDYNLNMYKPNRGACCSLDLISDFTGKNLSLKQKQNKIWRLFNIDADLQNLFEFASSSNANEDGVWEGREAFLLKRHKYYERDNSVIATAKRKAHEEGRLKCEVCNFDFAKKYPEVGNNFIECHHKIPIGLGFERKTKPSDLALVCSNCHRMLHRKHKGTYLNIQELKSILISNNG